MSLEMFLFLIFQVWELLAVVLYPDIGFEVVLKRIMQMQTQKKQENYRDKNTDFFKKISG